MDFSDVFDFGSVVEFIRQSDLTAHEVKGKHWLIENIYEAISYLDICKIEDELIFTNMHEWVRKL